MIEDQMTKQESIEFMLPPRVIFGAGSLSKLGDIAREFGAHSLLVMGRSSLTQSGIKAQIERFLSDSGVEVTEFEGVESNPSIETVDRGADLARASNLDLVIGVGGGSVIDAAKAISGLITNGGSARDYLEDREITKPSLPCIAVPTTAGTGAEVTKNAVITNHQEGYKRSIRSPHLIPAIALVDPTLTLTMPPHLTAATGMDALTQLIEPYVSKKAGPITDALAIYGIGLVGRSLRRAVRDGADLEARKDMALASLLSGMALANSGLGAVHGLSHPLGAHWDIHHGVACAILLPPVMGFNLEVVGEKYGDVARALGEDVEGLSSDEAALRALQAVKRLAKDIGIPSGLAEMGIKEKDLPLIAEESHGSSMSKNPRTATDEELVEILSKAM